MEKHNVIMCGSELSVKGGMVSVVKNYLGYDNWDNYNILYVPTHTEKHKVVVAFYFFRAYTKILFLLLTRKIEIAHLHTAERGSFYRKAILVRTFHRFGVKTIMHHHAAEFEEFYSGLSEKKKAYVNATLKMADVNIVLSKKLVNMITGKEADARVDVLYNAVKTYSDNPYNKYAKNIIFLGRLGKRKGTYDLLEAIKKIDADIPEEIQFYLCGDGDVEMTTRKVKELGIEHRIVHIGWIDGKRKESFFANSMINVLPSYNEGLPMTILETMAYGIPSITTNIASIPEVVKSGENGLMLDPGDIETLSKDLRLMIHDDEFRNMCGENAYQLVSNQFSLDNHMSELKNIYDRLTERS